MIIWNSNISMKTIKKYVNSVVSGVQLETENNGTENPGIVAGW
jgi:hypothetical protein